MAKRQIRYSTSDYRSNRYDLGEKVKTVAPLIAALDKWEDGSGQFAAWLEKRQLIDVAARYKETLPHTFYFKAKDNDWPTLEREYLNESGLMKRALRFKNGGMPTAKAAQALFAYALTFVPVLLIALWLANR